MALAIFIVNYEPDPGTGDWVFGMLGMATIFAPMLLVAGLTVIVVGLALADGKEGIAAVASHKPASDGFPPPGGIDT